jgi:hypothetical protein
MSTTALIQVPQAQIGAPLPLAYGYVRARGNNFILQELSDKTKVAFYILGEKEWDGIERLEINGALRDFTDVNLCHFHTGQLGTLGGGLAPSSNGPGQGVDNFFSLLPANYQRLTYSGWAYLAIHVSPDVFAPGPQLDVIGDYRACRVRIFDATGVQTSYAFSTNPVWQRLDLILRRVVKPEWDPAAAAAAGGDLSAAEKTRFDWASINDTAVNWCDFNIGGGIKRFENSVAWPQNIPLNQAMDYFDRVSQTYYNEAGGKIYIYADRPRSTTFILTGDHTEAGSFQVQKSNVRGAPNRFIAQFNDLNPQNNCDIDTPGNTGLSRTGNRTTVKVPAGKTHPFLVGDTIQIVNATDASFNTTIKIDTVPDNTTFVGPQTGANATSGNGYCGTVESRFAQRTVTSDHENHQLATGQRGLSLTPTFKKSPINLDFGNATVERVQRILNFLKTRNLGPDFAPYNAPFEAKVRCWAQAVDSQFNYVTSSEDFSSGWTRGGAVLPTITVDQQANPRDGLITADQIQFGPTGVGQESFVSMDCGFVPVVGKSYTFSCWVWAAAPTSLNLRLVQATGENDTVKPFNITTRATRFQMAITPGSVGTGNLLARLGIGASTGSTTVFAWGAQVEQTAIAGPYQKTAGTRVNALKALIAQLPGDIIAIDPTISEEFQGDYEITEMQITRVSLQPSSDTSQQQAQADVIDLTLREYLGGAYSDVADSTTMLCPSIQRGGLPLLNLLTETQNGVVLGRSYGKNILGNPSAESNNCNTQLGRDLPLGTDATDEWYVAEKSIYHQVQVEQAGVARTGRNNWGIFLKAVTIPSDNTFYGARIYTKAKIPVRIGDIIRVLGWIRRDSNAPGANITTLQRIGFFVFAADDTQLGELVIDVANGGVTSYVLQQVSLTVPATLGGGVPAYIRLQMASFIKNNTGAPVGFPANYAEHRFDDMSAEFQITPYGLTPTSTTMTITGGVNPLTQVGATTTINVAASTFQSGDGQISYNSGTYNPGGVGLWFIHADDPTYSGGAVTYGTTLHGGSGTLEAPGRVYFGEITTVGGGGAVGAGGGDGGGGPRGKDLLI